MQRTFTWRPRLRRPQADAGLRNPSSIDGRRPE